MKPYIYKRSSSRSSAEVPSPKLKLFAHAPAYDLVFASLSPRSLFCVARSCRAAYAAVTNFKARAFNVNRHFSRYFYDPLAFRSLQAKTSTLVSGSNVLQFLDRSFYPEADLDLYTHPGHSFEVAQFLVDVAGYDYAPRGGQEKDWVKATESDWDGTMPRVEVEADEEHAYPVTGIKEVWTFEKTNADQERLKVQIVEASSSPLESILGFHSTCVMNFIASDAAYSLYPVATFENRSALGMPSSENSDSAMEAIQKFFPEQARWVADKHTWRLPLDQTGVEARPPLSPSSVPLTRDPAVFNGWRFGTSSKPNEGYECQYYPLRSTLFRYNYAVPDEPLVMAIREWADVQGIHTHQNVPTEDWVWFDADLPAFYRRKHNPDYSYSGRRLARALANVPRF